MVFVSLLGLAALLTPSPTVSAATVDCTDVDTSIIKVECDPAKADTVEGSAIWALLLMAITILTAGVGLVAVAGVVYGAILYTTASGDPAKVKKALSTFTNVAIGVVAYAAMFMVLNFITPGGLFN